MCRRLRSTRSVARGWRGLLAIAALLGASVVLAAEREPGFADALLGRWNLTVQDEDGPYPAWLELRLRTELTLMGRFVGRVGSVRHVSALDYDDGRLEVIIPRQYEPGAMDLRFEAYLVGERLEGTTLGTNGNQLRWTGERAPALERTEREPGAPLVLFNGQDLAAWQPRSDAHPGCWSVASGALVATPPCVDLLTDRVFDDFVLHVELSYPQGSNSGVYLRGRYEIQIQDDAGKALDPLRLGGVYGFLAPSVDAAKAADEWQTLDVTLVGRRVSVVLNGVTIIAGDEIPGITGGALDSREAAPGPIMLQGDHGEIRFRSITLTPYR